MEPCHVRVMLALSDAASGPRCTAGIGAAAAGLENALEKAPGSVEGWFALARLRGAQPTAHVFVVMDADEIDAGDVDALFETIDHDGSGVIDYREVRAGDGRGEPWKITAFATARQNHRDAR